MAESRAALRFIVPLLALAGVPLLSAAPVAVSFRSPKVPRQVKPDLRNVRSRTVTARPVRPPVNPEPVAALTELLSSPNRRLRALAADELRRYGPAAASAAWHLRKLLFDDDPKVRLSAKEALEKIDPRLE